MTKAFPILLFCTAFISNCFSQVKEPWQQWSERPSLTPLLLNVNVKAENLSTVALGIADLNTNVIGIDCNTFTDTNRFVVQLQPHTEYSLSVTGAQFAEISIFPQTYVPRRSVGSRGTSAIPKPYKLFVDGIELPEGASITNDFGNCGANEKIWNIEVRPDRGFRPISLAGYEERWRRDEENVDSLAPGDGLRLELGPGLSTNTARAGFRWGVNMGRLWNGNSAGLIRLQEFALGSNIYSAGALSFTIRSTNTTELHVITNASGQLRQIKAPQAMADIQSTNGQCDLKFYTLSQIGAFTNGAYPILTNSPFVSWKIKNPSGAGNGTNLQVLEERPNRTNTSEIVYAASSTNWSLKTGSGSEQRTESRVIGFSSGNRIETVEIKQGTNSAYAAVETYHPYPWGWELTNVVSGSGSTSLTNSFDYYQDPEAEDSYTNLKEKRFPHGAWEKWLYNENDQWLLKPWKDLPATPDTAAVTNSLVRFFNVFGGSEHIERKVTEYYGPDGILDPNTGDANTGTNTTYVYEDRYIDGGFVGGSGESHELQQEGTGSTSVSFVKTFSRPGNYLDDLPFEIWFVDLRMDISEHSPGTYNSSDFSFQTNSSGTDFISTTYHGVIDGDEVWGQYRYTNWHEKEITLDSLRSTRETKVYRNGNCIMEAMEVFKVNPTDGVYSFDPVSRHTFEYDSLGHRIKQTWIDPADTNVNRIVYSASYNAGAGDAELKLSQTNETGVRLDFGYDSLKRLTNIVRVGVTNVSYAAQLNISTNWTYDAAGRLSTETVTGGNISLTRTNAYDLSGRPTFTTSLDGIITSITYSADARTTTNTTAGGVTRITEKYRDGRTKSVTGTGQVAEFYDYDVTEESFLGVGSLWVPKNVTRVSFGSGTSPRWRETLTELAGRPRQERFPAGDSAVLTNNTLYHNPSTINPMSRIYATDTQVVDQDQTVTTLTTYFGYDGNSNTNYVQLDVGVRYEKSDIMFYHDGTGWFEVKTNYIGVTSGEVANSVEQGRLTGFSATNILDQVYSYDTHTNLTVTTTYVEQGNKLVTEVSDVPESSLNVTNVSLNDLLQSSTTASIATPARFYYDSLGRETSVTDPLGFTSSTSYDSLERIASQTDKTGATTSYAYYATNHANAGLVSAVTDAAGKKTYHAYNSRDQRTHTWGDVPYPEMRVYDSVYGDMTELRTFQGGTDWASSSLPSGFSGTASITRFYYDIPSGVLTNKTDAATNAVTFSYYRNNLVKTRTWARGVVTTHYYNEFSELAGKAHSDGTKAITNVNFNTFGQPQQITDAAGTHDFVYDYDGRLVSETIGSVQTTLAYDPVKGLKQRTVSNGSATVQHDFGYDAFGRVAFITNGAAKISYGYLANSDLVRFQTNQQGTNTLLTTRRWEYGARLGSISHVAGGQPFQSYNYVYDVLNRRTRATLQDGSAWAYGYNNRDEVISGKRYWEDFTPTAGQQYEYNFDQIGNRTSVKLGGDANGTGLRTASYTPNVLNQYSSRSNPSVLDVTGAAQATATNLNVNGWAGIYRRGEYYHEDLPVSNSGPIAQEITATAVYQGTTNTAPASAPGKVLVPPGTESFSFDLDGNLTQDGLWHYKWDAENRLVQMTNVTGLSNVSRLKLVFTNDHAGHRVAKKVFQWGSSDWSTTASSDLRFIYISDLLGAELNGSTAAFIRSYTWGLDLLGTLEDAVGIGGLVVATHHGGGATNLLVTYDGNGNIQGLIRADDSSVAARYEYGPFGEALRVSGACANQNPIRWSTKFWDEETGLVLYPKRPYSPSLGRWLSRDPIEEDDSINLYVFVLNSPINSFDALGLRTRRRNAPISNGVDWDEEMTSQTKRQIRSEMNQYNFYGKLYLMTLNHSGAGTYDFKSTRPGDTFKVNGRRVAADQFGNYIAGYSAAYGLPILGEMAVHGAGTAYGVAESIMEWKFKPSQLLFLGDDWSSFTMIMEGRLDGWMDALFLDIEGE